MEGPILHSLVKYNFATGAGADNLTFYGFKLPPLQIFIEL